MFKRFDTEDVVLSSELTTFPTWFSAESGDTDLLLTKTLVRADVEKEDYLDLYSGIANEGAYTYGSGSKCLFSVTYASCSFPPAGQSESLSLPVSTSRVIYGQYRALVLGDEESSFRFGSLKNGASVDEPVSSFFAMTVDRARFREKLDPKTFRLIFNNSELSSTSSMSEATASKLANSGSSGSYLVLAPDVTLDERYLDAGRVYELANYKITGSAEEPSYNYDADNKGHSYGYFLPDIGVILINADVAPFDNVYPVNEVGKYEAFVKYLMAAVRARSQESVPSNYVFVRVRNGEFNYSMNPTNIDEVGNIKDSVRINQPQSFITSVGLYNDSNDLVAVAKLSKPLVKDFTKEALIRIKVDY